MIRYINICLVTGLLLMFACGETEKDSGGRSKATADSLTITLNGETGKSILEITERNHRVDKVESSMGVFVKGIDSVIGSNGYAWFISVNDSMIQVASDAYLTNDSDVVKWHFRKY